MIAPGQHRLKRLQLVNWGTFDHYVDLPVPRRGLLITGESGSGKTSILDAIAVVLVPPGRVRLNAAAQEGDAGDRSRNLLTYVRGAYKREADSASGEPVTAYLRPGAAWSAICLTYDNGLGKTTSLLRLMHVASSATSTRDVRSLFMMAEEPVDLLSLEPYAENGLDMRKLKTAYPNWTITPTYSGFAQRMQRSFSLENDQAQLLLHKTQSAKNLSSLDALLRDFMLDPPDTYDLVEQAIEQFNELSAAHSSVVDAREQVDSLTRLENHAKRRATIIEQLDMLTAEREHLEAHTLGLSMIEEEAELERLLETVVALDTEVNLAESALAVRRAEQESARRAVDGLGGRELEILERERQLASTQLDLIQKTKNRFLDLAEQAGLELPESHAEFGRFNEQIAEQLAHAEESAEQREQRFNLTAQADQATSARRAIEQQLQTLEAQRSTLDVRLLDLRRLLAQTAGVASERLGFAGELISVRADQAIWTGAIERVLRNLAQTLLVPDDLYPLVSDYVDRNHLGQRLVYQRIPNQFEQVADPDDQRSLIYKVDIAPSEHADWLYTDLVRRFDYLCVQNAAELRTVRRGVTLTGQVKHSSSRHEKDDRSRIDDQSRWVLGSSLEMKRTALLADLERLRSIENEAKHQRDEQESQLRLQQGMARILSELSQLDWQMIDIQSRQIEFDRISAQITTLLSEQEDLARAQALLKRAELAVNDTEQSMNKLRDRRSRTQQQFDTKAEHLDKITLRFGVLAEVP
ncbi:MAG: hypothetical protein FWD45_03000, partial [Coriobacteriia bacterium]|nr:hypothetical protein [Coriobacteriia bacterium]